jgi:ABC-type transport system involved in multi-copper enzyme maturation permease subunit
MTAGFLLALRGEIYLACRSRGVAALLLISMAMAAGRISLGKLAAVARQVEEASRGAARAPANDVSGYGPFTDGLAAGLMIGLLLLLVLAAASIALDRDLGVIRIPLTRRVSRSALVLAKFASLVLLGCVLVGAVMLAAWGAASLFYDFTPIAEDGYVIFPAAEIRGEIALGLGLAALCIPAAVALGLLISASARSATEAVSIALPLVLAFDVLKGLLGKAGPWIFLSFEPTLLDRSYLNEASKLARGFSDAGFSDRLLHLNLAVPLPEALLLLGLALWIAGRRKM